MQASGSGGGGTSGGSISTVDDNVVMSSEDSSNPEEAELELGLGLSLGGGRGGFKGATAGQRSGQPYARIFTAEDLIPSKVSADASSSSTTSSSSSTLSRANGTAGTKRTADSVTAPSASASQVVGWPPIRAYRMNSMVNQAKPLATEEFNSMSEKNKSKNTVVEKSGNGMNMININAKARTSLFVKVNMDGIPIGRKVDLNAHGCYETLAQALEDMFLRSTTAPNATRLSVPEHKMMVDARRLKLLDGLSDFVLTYEDKEGDWMLVGDVPWGMFISSVKRLRIMRTSEATGLAPNMQERNGRQRTKPL